MVSENRHILTSLIIFSTDRHELQTTLSLYIIKYIVFKLIKYIKTMCFFIESDQIIQAVNECFFFLNE